MIRRTKREAWTKPEPKRLGTIKEVAGAQGMGDQAATTKT